MSEDINIASLRVGRIASGNEVGIKSLVHFSN